MMNEIEIPVPLTLGELVDRLEPEERIIVKLPNGAAKTLTRYSQLDYTDATLQIVRPYLYDELSKTFRVKVKPIDRATIGLHSTETGFHWDISNFPPYLENDRKIIWQLFDKIYDPNHIDRIISQPPATIIFWGNGEKTVVKTEPDDEYDLEKGILYAILKHVSTKKDYDHYLRTIDKEVESNGETN